ncbi:MAG: hypothetical protein QM765_37540 [Myxococcales bacterium]
MSEPSFALAAPPNLDATAQAEQLARALAAEEAPAREALQTHCSSPELPRQAIGWLALALLGRERPLAALELYEAHRAKVAKELSAVVASALGPLQKRVQAGAAAAEGGEGLMRAFGAWMKAEAEVERAWVLAGAGRALRELCAGPAGERGDGATASLRSQLGALAIGGPDEQRFMCELAGALSGLDVVRPATQGLLHGLAAALVTVLEIGDFRLRLRAVEGLGVVAAKSPGALETIKVRLARSEEPAGGGSAQWAQLRDGLRSRFERYALVARAIAGAEGARAELLQQLGARQTGPFVAALLLNGLGMVWRHCDPASRAELGPRVAAELGAAQQAACQIDPRSGERNHGLALLRQAVAEVAAALAEDPVLREPARAALRAVFAFARNALPDAFAQDAAEVDVARAVYPALARLARTSASEREQLLATLREVVEAEEDGRWLSPGSCEGAFAALPELLAGTEGREWKEPFLALLVQCAQRPPAPGDLLARHRFLAAWAALNELVRRARAGFAGHAAIAQLSKAARGQPLGGRAELDAGLFALLAQPSSSALAGWLSPPGEVQAATPAAPDPGQARGLRRAAEIEGQALRELQDGFGRWDALGDFERRCLTALFSQLARGSVCAAATALDARKLSPGQERTLARARADALEVPEADGAPSRRRMLLDLARTLPNDAATALEGELEGLLGPEGDAPAERAAGGLDPVVLALVDARNSFHVCATLARLIDLHARRMRAQRSDFDLAVPLYQVCLLGPNPAVFEHLAARLEPGPQVRLALLFARHARASEGLERVAAHAEEFLSGSAPFASPALSCGCEVLEAVKAVASLDAAALPDRSEDAGGLVRLFAALDALGGYVGRELALRERHAGTLTALCDELARYRELPVGLFGERAKSLDRALASLLALEEALRHDARLRPPESLLAVGVVRHLAAAIRAMREQHVERARALVESGAMREFFAVFVHDGPEVGAPGTVRPSLSARQRHAYEEFYVERVSAELDVEMLGETLSPRWSRPLRWLYATITNLWAVLAIIAAPYVLLALLSRFASESVPYRLRGAGFALYVAVVVVGLLVVLGRGAIGALASAAGRDEGGHPHPAKPEKHAFEAFLPQLVGRIVVPMAVLVDFDHSYHFPLNASDEVIVLLVVLSLLSTAFYIGKQLVGEPGHETGAGRLRHGRRLLPKLMGLALFESFVAAVLLATLFGSNYFMHSGRALREAQPFLGVIPKHVDLDLASLGSHAPAAEHGAAATHEKQEEGEVKAPACLVAEEPEPTPRFTVRVFPTLVLVWTALGLFIGVFLEGFFKGEGLRGHEE